MTFPRVVCTLGSTTDPPGVLDAMVAAGMGLARVNTAYGSAREIEARVDAAIPRVPVMLDLKGRQLRLDCTTTSTDEQGVITERPCRYPIAAGDLIAVGFDPSRPVRFNHSFAADLAPDDVITFDNGTIRAVVVDPEARGLMPAGNAVLLEVREAGAGRLSPGVGANVPGKRLSVPNLTARDREMLALGVARGVPWYALSFVQAGADLRALHDALVSEGDEVAGLIAKVEDDVGVTSLSDLCETGTSLGRPFAVMVARGDLFVELGAVRLFDAQERLVRGCARMSVPSIVATGLLLSMQANPRPTRSEACDVAAAVRMGATSLMLSDETSNGKHPVAAVETLAALISAYSA